MSTRTHYTSPADVIAKIDAITAKRDKNLRYADWLECGAKWLRERAAQAERPNLRQSALAAEEEAARLRSAADHEDKVTLVKLKAKLAEIQTPPLVGVTDATVAKR